MAYRTGVVADYHVRLGGRSAEPIALTRPGRWLAYARDQVTGVRLGDMRFAPEEAAAFLNDVMCLNLSLTDVTAARARTEGWIAGLQMAALSNRPVV